MTRIVALFAVLASLMASGCHAVADVLRARTDPADYFSASTVELLEAARKGDEPRVRSLIADGADVNERGDNPELDPRRVGITPLKWAVEFARPITVSTLLRSGADAHLADAGGYNAVAYALLRDRYESLRALIETDPALVEAADRIGGNVVHTAVRHRRDDGLRLLIENGANVNSVQPGNGRTPLFTAADVFNIEHCLVLLRAGADGGHRDRAGATFLPALYTVDDSVRSGSFLRTRAAIEDELRKRGFPIETER